MKIGFIKASIDESRTGVRDEKRRRRARPRARREGVMTFIYGEKGRSICGVATRQGQGIAGIDIWSGYVAVGPRRIKVVAAGSPKDFWDTAWAISRALPRWKQTLTDLTAAWWRLTWRLRT